MVVSGGDKLPLSPLRPHSPWTSADSHSRVVAVPPLNHFRRSFDITAKLQKEGLKRGIAALRGSHLGPGVRASSDKSKLLAIQISCSSAFDSEGYSQIRTAVAATKPEEEDDGEVL